MLKDSDWVSATACALQVFIGWPQRGPSDCSTQLFGPASMGLTELLQPGLSLETGENPPLATKIADLPLLKARWARSVCYWYDHLPTVFVPSVEDIIPHLGALINSPDKPSMIVGKASLY